MKSQNRKKHFFQTVKQPHLLSLLKSLAFHSWHHLMPFVLRVTCSAVSWWWTRWLKPETPWWKCSTTRTKCWSCSTRTVPSRSPPNWSVKNGHKRGGRGVAFSVDNHHRRPLSDGGEAAAQNSVLWFAAYNHTQPPYLLKSGRREVMGAPLRNQE